MKHCTGMLGYFPIDLLRNSTSSMILISVAFICYFRSSFTNPPIAQLEERWTVAESTEIHRSLVQVRLGGSNNFSVFFKTDDFLYTLILNVISKQSTSWSSCFDNLIKLFQIKFVFLFRYTYLCNSLTVLLRLTLRWHRCERIQCEISNAKSVKMPSDKSYNCAISTASRCHEFSVRDCRVQHAMQTLFHRSDTEKTTCFSIRYR
ncbi:hypothetical protein T09_10782 [Trichinella sp. T9]|nr:hypothetical protein T09_10782 [Trichinella sp. T9]